MYQIKYLLFNLNNIESFNEISNIVEKPISLNGEDSDKHQHLL